MLAFSLIDKFSINLFLACGNFCHLLITVADNLDPEQD